MRSLFAVCLFALCCVAYAAPFTPFVGPDVVFLEENGMVAAEAEHAFEHLKPTPRAWYLMTSQTQDMPQPDGDGLHLDDASGGAYLEILPDTRRASTHTFNAEENFTENAGSIAALSYRVYFQKAGRYYVWARLYSTNSEDNSMHVGIDGAWPESGRRMQWMAKNTWSWCSKQRTVAVHTGVPYQLYLDVDKPGEHIIQFAMREDGTEFDKWLMTLEREFPEPKDAGPAPKLKSGVLPKPFAVEPQVQPQNQPAPVYPAGTRVFGVGDFPVTGTGFYVDQGKWFAINPTQAKSARTSLASNLPSGIYHVTLQAVGENDGQSKYHVSVNGRQLDEFVVPFCDETYEEGERYATTWKDVTINTGDAISVEAFIASADGKEYSRGRWAGLTVVPADDATKAATASAPGSVRVQGELKKWHAVTLRCEGPYTSEDAQVNPFTDYRLNVTFTNGNRRFVVPGYYAADGNAANTGASRGNIWLAHFTPDATGEWTYRVDFRTGQNIAVEDTVGNGAGFCDGAAGSFTIASSDKSGRDLRAKGRLQYVNQRYLRFAETGEFFVKGGADSPENFLAYADFDGDFKKDGEKDEYIKTWTQHIKDWQPGDPTWQNGKGKGIIGAINYLAREKGINAFSFLTMNINGDDRNVFPYTSYGERYRIDCSRLAQWEIVFSHADSLGLYLHFKTQETENDDLLDGGELGIQRKLYYRELIARFAHHLALNWNLGEENDNTDAQRKAFAQYFAEHDPYQHLIVLHTHNGQYDRVYRPMLGAASRLTGLSIQTGWNLIHAETVKWVRASTEVGKPWVVASDEQGSANDGVKPDADDPAHDGIRQETLWGNLMAGGGGVELYFGYQFAHSDLTCEDFRSRDIMWNQVCHALDFFTRHLPFTEMMPDDAKALSPDAFCLCKPGEIYAVYLKKGGEGKLDLTGATGEFTIAWYNPRLGGELQRGTVQTVQGGAAVSLGEAPGETTSDWAVLVTRR